MSNKKSEHTSHDDELVEQEGKLEADTSDEEDITVERETDADHAAQQSSQTDSKVTKLRKKVKRLKREKQEYLDEMQRMKAEFQNARKRDEEKKEEDIARANERLVVELLPVVDSFEMAFSDKQAYEQTPENWRKGVEHIYSQLMSTLTEFGLSEINPMGEEFDPNYHEAIERISVSSADEDNTVVEVVQKGYLLNNAVVRTAKVKVGSVDANEGENNEA